MQHFCKRAVRGGRSARARGARAPAEPGHPSISHPEVRAASFARIDLTLLETLRAASTLEVHMLQHEGRKANELEYECLNPTF